MPGDPFVLQRVLAAIPLNNFRLKFLYSLPLPSLISLFVSCWARAIFDQSFLVRRSQTRKLLLFSIFIVVYWA